jgi:hypothetical protein
MPTFDTHKNFATTTVTIAPSPAPSGTSLTVQDGSVFGATPFNATVYPLGSNPLSTNAEIVRVTNVSANTLTITRTQEGSLARNIIASDRISATITAKTFTDIETSFLSTEVTLVDGATVPLNASQGNVFRLTALGNRTLLVPSNPTAGQRIVIVHFASGGARTLTLTGGGSGFRFGTDITGITATSSGKTDYIGCIYNITDTRWDVIAYVKGF